MQDLLVGVLVQLVVVQADDNLRIVAIQGLTNGCIYLQFEHLNGNFQLRVLLELLGELSLGGDVVLGAPLVDLAKSDLVNRLLNPLLRRLETLFLVLLLSFPHDEAYLWQDNRQLQFVVLKQYEHVTDLLSIEFLTTGQGLSLR